MKINLVKLATELANEVLNNIYGENETSYFDTDEECMRYKSDYQDLFNDLYDKFYNILEEKGLEHENK